ncbi:MAG TPA: class I SAM-dependent methyltransferase, partial [Gaiellaceae bacterium]
MGHPVFARVFGRLIRCAEPTLEAHRRELVAGLQGRVAEIGAGTGASFRHYRPEVDELVAVEPEPYLRGLAAEAARGVPIPVRMVDGAAEALPLETGAFDAVVVSLVLCSVPEQAAALSEIRRVLRPGGELRFWEHVAAAHGTRLRRLQRALDLVWPRLGGGCHTARDTVSAIEAAGFAVEQLREFDLHRGPT